MEDYFYIEGKNVFKRAVSGFNRYGISHLLSKNQFKRGTDLILKIIKISLSVVIIIWFIAYLSMNIDKFASIFQISIFHFTCIATGIILTLVVNNLQSIILLHAQDSSINFFEGFLLQSAAMLANHLPLRFGTLLRIRYLKQCHSIRYARSGSLFSIRLITIICMTGLLGCLGLIIGRTLFEYPINFTLMISFILLIIISILFFLIPKPEWIRHNHIVGRVINDFVVGVESLRKNKSLFIKMMLLNLIRFIVMAHRLYFTFQTLQFSIPVWILLLIAPITTLITVISFLPAGNLGLRESIIGYITLVTGQDFNTGFFAGAVDRAILFLITLVLGIIGLVFCYIRMRNFSKINGGYNG